MRFSHGLVRRVQVTRRAMSQKPEKESVCSICGDLYSYNPNGYGHATRCWKCAPTRLPLRHGIRSLEVRHPRKTRKH